ncbi:transporter substrate-binding domain-containing protein [Paraburkholderia sp. J12]|uniref:transporter substrate-binding domain-containing protein n=1 Tax=Paraburkholderia sp. J12 TaxID=2805432 RepID=UPI002ABD7CEA|nr:transporter substrate-binding domain-containing protein [Paraburkholderia sp. J12]
MNRSAIASLLAVVCACASAASAASADELESATLRKIRDTGTIVLGVREAAVPFSYFADGEHATGYSQDVALRIVDAVRTTLGLPGLQVREVPVTAQDRIQLVQNGSVDLECSTTTHTRERDAEVAFSNSIFVYGVRMLVKRGSPVKEFEDLAGHTVVTTTGTSEERLLRRWNLERGMNMRIIVAKTHAASFDEVKTGRAAAFVMDEPLLYGALASGRDGNDSRDYAIVGKPVSSEVYACMFRRGDDDFKHLADNVVAKLQRSGEADTLYQRWFETPIPPTGVNLQMPMSAPLKALFANPNDRPLD